jgi:hypothetical protein
MSIEFVAYQSKPITRMAFQITAEMLLWKNNTEDSSYGVSMPTDTISIQFKAYEQPVVGDWVVRLTEEDTYHVTDKVFRERNLVMQ